MRGATQQNKIHYQGASDDFLIFVDDIEAYNTWKKGQTDKSISKPALSHFVSTFKVFVTHKQGAQGTYDEASNAEKENEFGTKNDDDVIEKILREGVLQESTMPERQGNKNDTQGALLAH